MSRRLTWDEIRELLNKMDGSAVGRTMIVTIIRDTYIDGGTILVSIEGSPPRAYALLCNSGTGSFDPDKDEVVITRILLLSCCFLKRRLLRGPFTVSLNELKQRKDAIVSVTSPIELLKQSS